MPHPNDDRAVWLTWQEVYQGADSGGLPWLLEQRRYYARRVASGTAPGVPQRATLAKLDAAIAGHSLRTAT